MPFEVAIIINHFITAHYFITMPTVAITNTLPDAIITSCLQQPSFITIVAGLPYITAAVIIRFAGYSNRGSGTSAYFGTGFVRVLLVGPLCLGNEVHV